MIDSNGLKVYDGTAGTPDYEPRWHASRPERTASVCFEPGTAAFREQMCGPRVNRIHPDGTKEYT